MTFADRHGRNPPGFASAGDCYSRLRCAQGRFMVNLERTGGASWWPVVRVLPMGWSHSVYIGKLLFRLENVSVYSKLLALFVG